MLLSSQDIEELTGAKHVKGQREFLEKHHITYFQRKDGKLSVTWHAVHNPKQSANQPNWAAL